MPKNNPIAKAKQTSVPPRYPVLFPYDCAEFEMALGFRARSSWKQSLGISALLHSMGIASLFAMSVPIVRTLVLQKGLIAVETIVAMTKALPIEKTMNGGVSVVAVEKSSDTEGLDRAAIEAVIKWIFETSDIASGLRPELWYAPIAFKIAAN